jgi:hypothetical protein
MKHSATRYLLRKGTIRESPTFRRVSLSGAPNRGVSFCFEDAAAAAPEASMFWHGGANPYVVPVKFAALGTDRSRNELFDINAFNCEKTVLRFPNGIEHILFRTPSESIQLLARGSSILDNDVCATFEINGLAQAKFVSAALRNLARLKTSIPSDSKATSVPWNDASLRLRDYLIALDGSLHGATYRQIALVIHGPDRVKDEWTGESRYLKERMRRAVEAGREYMNGGYRKLLT